MLRGFGKPKERDSGGHARGFRYAPQLILLVRPTLMTRATVLLLTERLSSF